MRPYYYLGRDRALTQLADGHPFFVNTRDVGITTWIILGGSWEVFVDTIICGLVRSGDRVLDAGANQGYYTVKLGLIVGETGSVDAFEPNSELFPILESNVSINGLDGRVRLHRKALGDAAAIATLSYSYANMGGGTLHTLDHVDQREVIDVVAGDEFLPSDTTFDFLKFDIEGLEPDAAAGLEQCIARSAMAPIIVEVTAKEWAKKGDLAEILHRFSRGFRMAYQIAHDGQLDPMNISDTDCIAAMAKRDDPIYVLLMPPNHWGMNFVREHCRGYGMCNDGPA